MTKHEARGYLWLIGVFLFGFAGMVACVRFPEIQKLVILIGSFVIVLGIAALAKKALTGEDDDVT